MTTMRLRILVPMAVVLVGIAAAAAAPAQTTPAAFDSPATYPASAAASEAEEKKWAFSLSAYTYIVEDSRDYVQPTFRADHDWLHLEARYNYENLDTASIWVGYNWSVGETLTLDFTAMVGGVFGRTRGIAPGYELTLAWHKLQLYSELEYVFDAEDSSESFLYTWSELTYALTDWLRAGIVIQRTRAYEGEFDIQRGFMAGITYKSADFTVNVLNPDDHPIFVLSVAFDF
jgi:hypothetical protein